jgi:hypothetical protein
MEKQHFPEVKRIAGSAKQVGDHFSLMNQALTEKASHALYIYILNKRVLYIYGYKWTNFCLFFFLFTFDFFSFLRVRVKKRYKVWSQTPQTRME